MNPQLSTGDRRSDPTISPRFVRVLRTLGQGRAARAQLVEAALPDGRTLKCVEKVFAPGLLTRTIYRVSFQSPFAYQSNRDAILACFYRRRVASAVLAGSQVEASIALPLYVRFDQDQRAWVLAAEWIDGRGVKPAPPNDSRIRRRFSSKQKVERGQPCGGEIGSLVRTMEQLESVFRDCGLIGSGWQVAPRAMVSTANLLRVGSRYTVIDLESGIPAVLVPRYLVAGLRQGALPPFDDLDADRLRAWLDQNERLLTFRIGPTAVEGLRDDCDRLIKHSAEWKQSELALFRRPWRLLTREGFRPYQRECVRRWQQDKIVDDETAEMLSAGGSAARWIWYAGLLPSSMGRFAARLIGRRDYRDQLRRCLSSPMSRAVQWQQLIAKCQTRLVASGRIPASMRLTKATMLPHLLMRAITPRRVQRFVSDPEYRRNLLLMFVLLLLSPRFQSWVGQRGIESSIRHWERNQRISSDQANELRRGLCGNEVRAYTRGFGMHLALKTLGPIILPAKVGGVAAFLAAGNPWFLLPLVATPMLRTAVCLANWWATRGHQVRHAEALAVGILPTVGSLAFPVQMFMVRPTLSTFLVRDAASKFSKRIPIYGGENSRTEIAAIAATDYIIEFMQVLSALTLRVLPWNRDPSSIAEPVTLRVVEPRRRFARWLDDQAIDAIAAAERESKMLAKGPSANAA